jgi:hypothetical protein
MRGLTCRRHAAAVLLLVMMGSFSLTEATPAHAAGSAPAAVHAATLGWTFYATYPNHSSCLAAATTSAEGRKWQCVVSARPGAFDLYFWS